MRLLFSGDLHLGRRPTRLPDSLPDASTASVWARVVEAAIAHAVDAVLLSGDLVDQDNRFFEALGPLERGMRRLHAHGVRTVAVAGNHDHAVLPALARALPPEVFTWLGGGGRWEQVTLTSAHDASQLHVLGWSFPDRTVRQSPLVTCPRPTTDGVPTLGLLHGDLDATESDYAPLSRADLARVPVCAWVLGHIHAGGVRAHDPLVLYPGSPQPLDPGEPGVHGAWLAELDAAGRVVAQLLPLASVQYDTVSVDLRACTSVADARVHVANALRAFGEGAARDGLLHLALRVRLQGRTTLHGTLSPLADELRSGSAFTIETSDGRATSLSVTHVHGDTLPWYDLQALAEGTDVVAHLAQLRCAVAADGVEALPAPLRAALAQLPRTVITSPVFAGSGVGTTDEVAYRTLVTAQMDRLLDALLAQRPGRGAMPDSTTMAEASAHA
jgi:predicted phosphodiesterase